jgi:hypothetical protein
VGKERMADPFSYDGYRELLRDYLAGGYRFGSFSEVGQTRADGASLAVMRHDIDFDLAAARRMAEIEQEAGIQATYFYLLRTEHYNVFSPAGSAEIARVLELGHHLGLHFDCAAYPTETTSSVLAEACRREADLLANWFGRDVEIVSYHRPSPLVLTGDPELSAPLPHTYTSRFMKGMKYCSDSRGRWHYGDPRATSEFAARAPMHILIHPVWWNEGAQPAGQTLDRWLSGRLDSLQDSMAANCTVYIKRGTADVGADR